MLGCALVLRLAVEGLGGWWVLLEMDAEMVNV